MKNKKKLGKNGGFYIALCGCAVVVAVMSYVGDVIKEGQEFPETENIALNDISDYEFSNDEEETVQEEYETVSENEVIVIEPEEETEEAPEQEEIMDVQETAAKEEIDEFLPALPVPGKVIAEFSGQELVLFEKLDDWRSHGGIDIAAEVGDDVYVCESGVVEKIFTNNMGGCILVDHENGYKSLYGSIGEINLVTEGDRLVAGETVGRVGDAAVGDMADKPHVHFELHFEGKPVNPLDIITIE